MIDIRAFVFLLAFRVYVQHVTSFSKFQSRIPNGRNVKHPCLENYMWRGVGHKSHTGGGARNVFGNDFEKNDNMWTQALCETDSDGDGMTNGQELGDPKCVWTKGDVPTRLTDVTHPGVCEPIDSDKCKQINDWEFCKEPHFDCDAIKSTENIKIVEFPLANISLPGTTTSYFCQYFELPTDTDYHLIAFEALRDNKRMLHHIVNIGCPDDLDVPKFPKRIKCGMTPFKCNMMIAVWTVGMTGQCHHNDYGILVGKNGLKKIIVQSHYTNSAGTTGTYDASVMRLYLTDKLRPYNAIVMLVSTHSFSVPPRQPSYEVYAVCPGVCSYAFLKEPIMIASLFSHAHYTATSVKTEIYRLGKKVGDVVNDDNYSYDTPVMHYFDKPVIVHPGDEITVTCTYNTMSRNTTTNFGPGTFNEMCFIYIVVYPFASFRYQLSRDKIGICNRECAIPVLNCVSYQMMFMSANKGLAEIISKQVLNACSPDRCLPTCAKFLKRAKSAYDCLNLPWFSLLLFEATDGHRFPNSINFFKALRSCDSKSDRFIG